VPGDDLVAALNLAEETLAKTPAGGSLLLLADSIPAGQRAELAAWRTRQRTSLMILPLVAEGGDGGSLAEAAKWLKASTITLAADGSDTAEIVRRADRAPVRREADAAVGSLWREAGYWLTPVISLLILWGFRKVSPRSAPSAQTAALPVALALGFLLASAPACAQQDGPREAPRRSWFFTPNQLGQRLFAKGEYRAAAATFVDAQWRGLAWFRAGEFERAERAFSRGTTAEAFFNRGNALVMLGKYTEAAEQFAKALEARPGWREARENQALAEARAKMTEKKGGDMGDQKIGADQIVFEPGKGKKNEDGQDTAVDGGQALDDKALQALWLRNVQTRPADFLRAKFAHQHAIRETSERAAKEKP